MLDDMKPDDLQALRAPDERPLRVLLIAGSSRRQYSCPSTDSKARTLMFRMADRLPREWEIDVEDLGNVWNREQIQSCNGCVSTWQALCVWPCNCFSKDKQDAPDLMWNLDLYAGDYTVTYALPDGPVLTPTGLGTDGGADSNGLVTVS